MQRIFLGEMWSMIRRIHKTTFSNALWIISFLIFILTILGTITEGGILRTLSEIILGLVLILYFWHFFIEIPSLVLKEKTEQIHKLIPLEQRVKLEKDNPAQFILSRLECLLIEQSKSWVGCNIIISSRLHYEIRIKRVHLIILIPNSEGKHRFDMETRIGVNLGNISEMHDLKIDVHSDNDSEFSKLLLNYIGEHPCDYVPGVEGTVIITINDLGDITLAVLETSVLAEKIKGANGEIEEWLENVN